MKESPNKCRILVVIYVMSETSFGILQFGNQQKLENRRIRNLFMARSDEIRK